MKAVKIYLSGNFIGYYPSNKTGYNPFTLKGLTTKKPSYWDDYSIRQFKEYLKEELSQAIGGATYEIINETIIPSKRLVNTTNDEDNDGFSQATQAYALYVQDGKVLTDGYIYNNWREGGYTHMSDLHTLLKEIVKQYPNYLEKLNKHLKKPILL